MAKGTGGTGKGGRGGGGGSSAGSLQNPLSASRSSSSFQVGDTVMIPSTRQSSGLTGTVSKIGRVNVTLTASSQFRPNGPVFTSDYPFRIPNLPSGTMINRGGESGTFFRIGD